MPGNAKLQYEGIPDLRKEKSRQPGRAREKPRMKMKRAPRRWIRWPVRELNTNAATPSGRKRREVWRGVLPA